tara:strand:- start:675 stop:986 length:312 start_codon:yes stop_codon:yes gene_type:complete
MTVKNVRFISGENVICELKEEKDDTIVIADAIIAMPAGEKGDQIGFAPWAPLQDPDLHELEINRRNVMYITEAVPSLVEQYNSMFNKPSIVVPELKQNGKIIL